MGVAACTAETPGTPGLEKPRKPLTLEQLTPPAEHPRLYIRKDEIPALRIRMQRPEGKAIIKKMEKNAIPRTAEEEAAVKLRDFRYYFKMRGLTSQIQLEALDYLTSGDTEKARHAITAMLDTLQRTNFPTHHDLSRASGVMLMTGAIVYDWCYDQMSMEEKLNYIKEFKRIAGTMECHYPPKRNEPIAGHSSEWMVLRDMLSAGVAVYDEDPEIYNEVVDLLCDMYFEPRNYFYKGQNYHQGTSYINVRFTNDLISNWIFTKMGYPDVYVKDQQYVLYDLMYRRRPDGILLPAGDTNPMKRGSYPNYALPAMLASSLYHDPYLAMEYKKKPSGVEEHCLILELLWRDFDLVPSEPNDLPLYHYSGSPFGSVIARTGWDANSVIAEMKITEQHVGNHQHLDAGTFQIYYKGPLAMDTGAYQGSSGGYNSPHCKNYFKRTIAHNGLLIYDPDEVFECYNYGGSDKTQTAANDGGQRMPGEGWNTCRSFESLLSDEYTVGKELAHSVSDDLSYLKGDITKAYSKKVNDVRRSFVFINTHNVDVPAMMIIYDNVVAANPDFKKYFLMHSIEEPILKSNAEIPYFDIVRTATNYGGTFKDSGMLRDFVVLPEKENLEMTSVGGPGKEFWVFGTNYPNDATTRPDDANERGAWRVELSPAKPEAQNNFLNVIQIADNNCNIFEKVKRLDGDKVQGVIAGEYAVFFEKNLQTLGESFELNLDGAKLKTYNVLLTDLEPGKWKVTQGNKTIHEGIVQKSDGTLSFKGKTGKYTLTKTF